MPLYVGVCETNITPPPGVWMSGYAARVEPAMGVHDDLYARALVFDDGACRVALVSADLIAFTSEMVEAIRDGISAQCDIDRGNIMLHATHTHGGPHVGICVEKGPPDGPYLDILRRKVIGAVSQASLRMRPSYLTYGESSAQIGINRRPVSRGSKAGVSNFAGPASTLVQTLCVNSMEGRLSAMLFSHACHPTTALGSNRYVTADWPGAAVRHLRNRLLAEGAESGIAEDVVTVFLQSCSGDIDPYDRGSWQAISENGRAVADAAHTARWNAHGRLDDPLRRRSITAALPIAAENPIVSGSEVSTGGLPTSATTALELQCLTLGGIRILGIPAEPFVSYQAAITALSPIPILVLGYTNGCRNYLPMAKDFAVGGYEIEDAHIFYRQPMFTPECEDIFMDACSNLLKD